jgi:hypothetical protein
MTDDVLQLRTLDDFQVERPLLFPSASALQWFVRCNKAELVDAGALIKPAGRWLVQPAAFDAVFLAIGKRIAQRS